MTITRRRFLKSTAAATVVLVTPRGLRAATPPAARRTLVVVQLAGGNDSLNTLIPYADKRYRTLRPTLAIAERDLLPIDGRFGLHPALARLQPLYKDGSLALIDGVGFPSLDRSHFRCQDVWQTGDEGCGRDDRQRLGWIGRYADLHLGGAESPLVTLAIGNRAPLGMIVRKRRPTVIADLTRFRLPGGDDDVLRALRDIYSLPRTEDPLSDTIRGCGEDLFLSADAHQRTPVRPARAAYPESPLGEALRNVAAMIDAHVEVQAAWVTSGGFDTHAMQAGDHAALLSDLAASLAAFQADIVARSLREQVVLMAWSEFGRRAAENASAGTDHGKAGIVFVMGQQVRGGLYGEPPDLGRLDAGDVPPRVDFRSVYATLIRNWYGHDPEPVLGHPYPTLGFLRT